MSIVRINNFDSSFFGVKVAGIPAGTPAAQYLTDRVISFEIVEEMYKMIHGTLQMAEDDAFTVSNTLKRFSIVELQWGYKNKDQIQKDAYVKAANPKELFTPGQLVRVAKGRIQNPSWSCSSDGKMIYNCSFMCFGDSWLPYKSKIYDNDTKFGVVVKILAEIGITPEFVKFTKGLEIVKGDTSIRQDCISTFAFLNRIALEWQCLFRIAYDSKNLPVALFCDYNDDVTVSSFCNRVGSSIGGSILWEYKSGKRNVMSYTAQYNSAEGGSGDSVVAVPGPGGTMTFQRTIAETQTVTYYVLQSDVMLREMRKADTAQAQAQLFASWTNIQNFNELITKRYVTAQSSKTAPQGVGLTVNIEAIGDPLCTSPSRAKFGKGFPSVFSGNPIGTTFYQTSVSHKIDKSGYKMSVLCADAFSVSGGVGVG